MNNTYLFTFIIPVYNAESTLNRCLDSILTRDKQDYEVILINDSSKDNSLEICESYSDRYPQVSVYTFPNAGAGAARNRGLERAKGKYIIFCDSDDLYNSEELNKLLDTADKQMKDIDLLCFDYRRQWVDYFEDIKHFENDYFELADNDERVFAVSSPMLSIKFGIILWNKIYKREIIKKNMIRFPERDVLGNQNDWGEDLCFNIQYLLSCTSILTLDIFLYVNTLRTKRGHSEDHYTFDRGVFNHMSKMIFFLKDTFTLRDYSDCILCDIFIYFLRFYIIWNAKQYGIYECRKLYKLVENRQQLTPHIIKKILFWNKYAKNRFDKYAEIEYRFMLLYCITGDIILYKILCKLFLAR